MSYSTEIKPLDERVHFYIIKVMRSDPREIIEVLRWDRLPVRLRIKYDWYFRYRAALLQVKYPRHEVITNWGSEPAKGPDRAKIRKNKIASKKRQITKIRNQMDAAKHNWNRIFPIEEEPDWKKARSKLLRLESELLDIENNQP